MQIEACKMRNKTNTIMTFNEVFKEMKPVIGMIHTGSNAEISMLDLAKKEIGIYLKYGVVPLIENYFGSDEDCAEVLRWVHEEYPDSIYGVNILGDAQWAFELAHKYGAKFVQIDSVCGHLKPEHEPCYVEKLNKYREEYNVAVLGGVRFKYQPVKSGRTTEEDLLLGRERCDAVVCTGSGTGMETPTWARAGWLPRTMSAWTAPSGTAPSARTPCSWKPLKRPGRPDGSICWPTSPRSPATAASTIP